MNYRCPVCFFDRMPYPPRNYHICPCCGTEFGNDDSHFTHKQLREMWIASGAHWFFGEAPDEWESMKWLQLASAAESEGFRISTESSGTKHKTEEWVCLKKYKNLSECRVV